MRYALLLVCAVPLAACGNEPEVDVENASVAEVAREVGAAGGAVGDTFIRAGKWEARVTVENIDVPGMPDSVKEAMKGQMARNIVHTSCLTEEEAKRPKEDFFAGEQSKNCRYDHFRMGDGKIDAKMSCSNQGASQQMEMAGTYSPDSYNMRMTSQAEGGEGPAGKMSMTMRVESKRVGECDGTENA